jgi:hypothetical protein
MRFQQVRAKQMSIHTELKWKAGARVRRISDGQMGTINSVDSRALYIVFDNEPNVLYREHRKYMSRVY